MTRRADYKLVETATQTRFDPLVNAVDEGTGLETGLDEHDPEGALSGPPLVLLLELVEDANKRRPSLLVTTQSWTSPHRYFFGTNLIDGLHAGYGSQLTDSYVGHE